MRTWIQEGKHDPKNRAKLKKFIFWSAGCSFLRAEGFFFSLEVLYGVLGISNLQFLIKKRRKKFNCTFLNLSSKPWIRIPYPDPDSLEMLDPDPYLDPDSMNPDSQHWSPDPNSKKSGTRASKNRTMKKFHVLRADVLSFQKILKSASQLSKYYVRYRYLYFEIC